MNNIDTQYLQAMGIQVWEEREMSRDVDPIKVRSAESNKEEINKPIEQSAAQGLGQEAAWHAIQQQVENCILCELSKTRTHTVFGAGNQQADLLIIGEAPGANEDRQGEPFVGRAGKLLNAMLHAISLDRKDIYIANILKCRPPNNRDPLPREVQLCTPYLQQQIALLQPKLIVTVGRIAAHFLLDTTESMGRLRGRVFQYRNIPVLATYHPAYLLRSPRAKAKAYEDMLRIRDLLS
jgi:DNA polymerase